MKYWIPMLGVVFLVVSFTGVCAIYPYVGTNVMVALVFGVLSAVCLISSYNVIENHAKDLGILRTQQLKIQEAEHKLVVIKENMKELVGDIKEIDQNLLVQAGSSNNPISSVISNIDQAIDNIETRRNDLTYRKARIAERKASPFGWLFDHYGEE